MNALIVDFIQIGVIVNANFGWRFSGVSLLGFGEAETMNCKRYHVVVAMKPWVFDDDFARKPDKNSILQFLLDKLKDGDLDENFVVVVVEAKKER